jgi:hypothetical protein
VLDGGMWARMCWRMSQSVPREVVVSDDSGLTCPSPHLDGAKISNVGWCFHRCCHSPPRLPRGRR